MEAVEWIRNFQVSDGEISHSSFMGRRDLFTSSGKLFVPFEKLEEFYEKIAACISMNIPIFFSEIQTPVFPFIEDIDIFGDFRNLIFDPDFRFLRIRVDAIKSFCLEETRNFQVFSSSGFCSESGNFKTSIHLVWPDLLVNAEIAKQLRMATIKYFRDLEISNRFVSEFAALVRGLSCNNSWENIFDETSVRELNGLRMPFSDKISRLTGLPENRPLIPLGRFKSGAFDGSSALVEIGEWVKRGSCRRLIDAKVNVDILCSPMVLPFTNFKRLSMPTERFMLMWDQAIDGWWHRKDDAVIWQAHKFQLEVILIESSRLVCLYGNARGLEVGNDILCKVFRSVYYE